MPSFHRIKMVLEYNSRSSCTHSIYFIHCILSPSRRMLCPRKDMNYDQCRENQSIVYDWFHRPHIVRVGYILRHKGKINWFTWPKMTLIVQSCHIICKTETRLICQCYIEAREQCLERLLLICRARVYCERF